MGSNGSAQQPVTQQTQQSRDPWSVAQPALTQALSSAQSLYNQGRGYEPWTGATQAPINSQLQQSLNTQQQIANASITGTPGIKAGQALGLSQIQNAGLSPELKSLYEQAKGDQNPYLQSMLDTQGRRIGENVNSAMAGKGRYGSGMHTDVMTRALAEAADPVLAQDYARRQQQQQGILEGGLQRSGQWAQLMPTLDAAQYAPAERMGTIGQFNQERAQNLLNDQIKLYNAQQSRDWEQLARLNAIAGGAGGLGGTLSGTQTTPINQPSTLQRLFGGAAAGAGIGGSFGGAPGAGIGAGVGGLLGML